MDSDMRQPVQIGRENSEMSGFKSPFRRPLSESILVGRQGRSQSELPFHPITVEPVSGDRFEVESQATAKNHFSESL
jgi:hypothetical protein